MGILDGAAGVIGHGRQGMTAGRDFRIGETILGGGVLALGLFIAAETWRLPLAPSQAAVGPKVFPYIVAAGLIVVGVALLREAFAGPRAHEGDRQLDWFAVALVSAGIVVMVLLIERAGWIISATLLFAAVARAFGSRRILIDVLIGLGLAALTYVAFTYGLDLNLPSGEFMDFFAPADQGAAG